jgi:hypothetical protein
MMHPARIRPAMMSPVGSVTFSAASCFSHRLSPFRRAVPDKADNLAKIPSYRAPTSGASAVRAFPPIRASRSLVMSDPAMTDRIGNRTTAAMCFRLARIAALAMFRRTLAPLAAEPRAYLSGRQLARVAPFASRICDQGSTFCDCHCFSPFQKLAAKQKGLSDGFDSIWQPLREGLPCGTTSPSELAGTNGEPYKSLYGVEVTSGPGR